MTLNEHRVRSCREPGDTKPINCVFTEVDDMKIVNSLALRVLVAAGFLFAIQPTIAHHSFAGFSNDEVKEFTGTIKEFQFRNPHVWIQILTTNAEGQEEEWSVEWGSPNQLGRRGIRPATFPPGAEVTVRIRPMINGSAAGAFVGAKFPDGTIIGQWED